MMPRSTGYCTHTKRAASPSCGCSMSIARRGRPPLRRTWMACSRCSSRGASRSIWWTAGTATPTARASRIWGRSTMSSRAPSGLRLAPRSRSSTP
uniref:Uncharacterized protein n=1 Tax=uncultured marine virus TaxID=186617 RepID=A0A0F7LAN9_9VIRU|nr:hypothetical protein [uncultured marine virus]